MQQLDPAIVRVWTLLGAVPGAVVACIAVVVTVATGGHVVGWVAVGLAVASLLVLAGVVPRVRYRYLRFEVVDGLLRVADGVVFRSEAAVPVFRIQHVDLRQGPLERWAGVQRLEVHTASPAADVTLPGVTASRAPELRTHLLELSRDAVERYGVAEGADAV